MIHLFAFLVAALVLLSAIASSATPLAPPIDQASSLRNNNNNADEQMYRLLDSLGQYSDDKCTPQRLAELRQLKASNFVPVNNNNNKQTESDTASYVDYHIGRQVEACEGEFSQLILTGLATIPRARRKALQKLAMLGDFITKSALDLPAYMRGTRLASPRATLDRAFMPVQVLASALAKFLTNYAKLKLKNGAGDTSSLVNKVSRAIQSQFGRAIETVRTHLGAAADLYQQLRLASPHSLKNYSPKYANWMFVLMISDKIENQQQLLAKQVLSEMPIAATGAKQNSKPEPKAKPKAGLLRSLKNCFQGGGAN